MNSFDLMMGFGGVVSNLWTKLPPNYSKPNSTTSLFLQWNSFAHSRKQNTMQVHSKACYSG